MIAVSSSNVRAVDYDGSDLLVEYVNQSLYRYFCVLYEKFTGLLHASSPGGYLASHIKPYYSYRRIQ